LEAQSHKELRLAAVVGMRRIQEIAANLLLLHHGEMIVGQVHYISVAASLTS
jgi:hypothetical protein